MDIAVFAGAAVVATGALALRRVAAHTEAADVAEVAPGCFTKSKAAYVDKRSRIVGGGMSMLQVVADFDRTLTKNMVNGKQGFSAYRALESCEMLSHTYHVGTRDLRDKYYPIERSAELTREEKMPHMADWYRKAHELLLSERLTRMHIVRAVGRARMEFRDGVMEMVRALHRADAPLTIFSAGLGAVIEEFLVQRGALLPHVTVIANIMRFGEESGVLEEVLEPIVTMYNKDFSHKAGKRPNIILLGDSLGDTTMADGIAMQTKLSIGFLNDNVDALLPKYLEAFDVVVVDDGTFDLVNDILGEAAQQDAEVAAGAAAK